RARFVAPAELKKHVAGVKVRGRVLGVACEELGEGSRGLVEAAEISVLDGHTVFRERVVGLFLREIEEHVESAGHGSVLGWHRGKSQSSAISSPDRRR